MNINKKQVCLNYFTLKFKITNGRRVLANQLTAGISFWGRYEYNTSSFPCLSATVVLISM